MPTHWECDRDGCTYLDQTLEAGGGFNISLSPPVFRIDGVRPPGSAPLDAAALLRLLRLTCAEFPDCRIWCTHDKTTAPLLAELARSGQVKWTLLEHGYSRDALILDLAPAPADP